MKSLKIWLMISSDTSTSARTIPAQKCYEASIMASSTSGSLKKVSSQNYIPPLPGESSYYGQYPIIFLYFRDAPAGLIYSEVTLYGSASGGSMYISGHLFAFNVTTSSIALPVETSLGSVLMLYKSDS